MTDWIEQFSYFYADVTVIVGLDDDGFYSALYQLIIDGQNASLVKKCKTELIIQHLNGSVTSLARRMRTGKYDMTDKDMEEYLNICWDSIKL